jgi:hypothetical protein
MEIVDEQPAANKTRRVHGLALYQEGHPKKRRQIQE